MLINQPITQLMEMPEQHKVLASVITASGGDIGAYYERTGSGFTRAASLGVNSDQELKLAAVPQTLDAPSQRSVTDGQQLVIPVHSSSGEAKGFFVVQKLHHLDGNGQLVIDNAQGGVREQPLFSEGHTKLASSIADHFSAFCSPPERHVGNHLRQQLKHPEARTQLYREMADGMFTYIPRSSEQGRHISRVAPMASVIVDAIQRDRESKDFGHVFVREEERPVIDALITLHDVGKVQQQPSELEFCPTPPPPGGQKRNYNHPLYSFLILNLPGLEQEALMVADHHQGERKPFTDVPPSSRHAFSRVVALADKLEAMTGKRSCHTRPFSLEEAFAHLTTRIHDDVDPQLVRLLASQRVDRDISARFPDIAHSRDVSRIDQVHHKPLEILHVGICSGITPMDGMDSICAKIQECIPEKPFDMGNRTQPFMYTATHLSSSMAYAPGSWVKGLLDMVTSRGHNGHTAA